MARIGFELGAEMADVNADGFDIIVGIVAPNLFEDLARGNGLTVALQETVEKFKFEVGEFNGFLKPDGFKPFRY
jgi:hypothetical protein